MLVILFPKCSTTVADMSLCASVNTSIKSCFAISTKKTPFSWVFSYPKDKHNFHPCILMRFFFFPVKKVAYEHFGIFKFLIAIV